MNYSTIYGKQIIRIQDGIRIGTICDVSFDPCNFHLKAIYACVPLHGIKKCFPMLFQKDAIEISIEDIVSIDGDVILIR